MPRKKPFSIKQRNQQRKEHNERKLSRGDPHASTSDRSSDEDGESMPKPSTLQTTSATTDASCSLRSLVPKDSDKAVRRQRVIGYEPILVRCDGTVQHGGVPCTQWYRVHEGDNNNNTPPDRPTPLHLFPNALPLPPTASCAVLGGETLDHAPEEQTHQFQAWVQAMSDCGATCFEMNEQVWHQLFCAVSGADALAIVVDVRFVPVHYPTQLIAWLDDIASDGQPPLPVVLILNKADLVPCDVVERWRCIFLEEAVGREWYVIPFSSAKPGTAALAEFEVGTDVQLRLHGKKRITANKSQCLENEEARGARRRAQADLLPFPNDEKSEEEELSNTFQKKKKTPTSDETSKATVVPSVDALLAVFRQITTRRKGRDALHVALVGQPNVGKSSIINVLAGCKKVSVSSTPGHTKRVQHIHVHQEDALVLLDCPGLLFPIVNVPKSLLIISGVFPISQNREHYSAIRYLFERLPIEKTYRLKKLYTLEDYDLSPSSCVPAGNIWSAYEVSESLAEQKGFYLKRGNGRVDTHRAGELILKDVFEGRISFYLAPP